MADWLASDVVLDHLDVATSNAAVVAQVERARLAAKAYVERVRPDLFGAGAPVDGDGDVVVPEDVVLGAVLYAARWHSRRTSPAGVATFGDFGPASVSRLDLDADKLLAIGRYAKPRAF